MAQADDRMFKLTQQPGGLGLRCTPDGLSLAGVALLERGPRGFVPRPRDQVRHLLGRAYETGFDFADRIGGLGAVARALNEGELSRAMIAAVLLELPELDGMGAARLARAEARLAKYDPDEPRDGRGRWTSTGGFPPGVPAYRRELIPQMVWDQYGQLVEGDRSIGMKGQYVLAQIFAAEGGTDVDPKSGAKAGITPGTLEAAIKAGVVIPPEGHPPLRPQDLKLEEVLAVQKWYLDENLKGVGGFGALEDFRDGRTAAAVADTLYLSGGPAGTKLLRQALQELSPGGRVANGRLGPKTWKAITDFANSSPENNLRFREKLADIRAAGHAPGVRDRVQQFG
jgi:hypothetical protein